MKILFIVNELLYTCGVSNHVYNLLYGIKEHKNIEIIILCGGGNAIDKYRKLGYKVIVEKEIRHEGRSVLKYIIGLMKLYKIIKKHQIDIVHSHHHYAANMADKTARFCGIKTVMTNHALLPDIGRLSHFAANYVIVLNNYIFDQIKAKKIINPKNIRMIRNGIFETTEVKKIFHKKLNILVASRLVSGKGIELYINAVIRLPQSIQNKANFLLAGTGEKENFLLSEINKYKAPIRFLGNIDDLRNKLNEIDIFIIPSLSEALPMTLIEASFATCLVIISRLPWLDEIFEENVDGLVFENGNVESLRERLEDCINNFERILPEAKHFHDRALNLFSLKTMVLKTIQVYKECLTK